MGITGLTSYIKKRYPNNHFEIKLEDLRGVRLAVDISIFLYKYIKSAGPERWIDQFLLLLCVLKKNGIKTVCIFDGPDPPKEKKLEQDDRRAQTAKQIEKMKEARKLYAIVKTKYALTDTEIPPELGEQIKIVLGPKRAKNVNLEDSFGTMQSLSEAIDAYERQTMPITTEQKQKAQDLVISLGIPCYEAPGEAEALCSHLCVRGDKRGVKVDAVFSRDSDCLAYGTPLLISEINLQRQVVEAIYLPSLLEEMQLSYEEFRDACIVAGCDYNDRAYLPAKKDGGRDVPVGIVTAFNLIHEHRRIEEIEDMLIDPSPLNYRRCREIFTIPKEGTDYLIAFNGQPDYHFLEELLEKVKCSLRMQFIQDSWKSAELVFEGAEVEENDDDFEYD